ncbi:hypothetical protein IE53DRAFT_364932 [Violaceomyces palustris]|uniref:Uncharacterized protein n=1 Tax=Violaceomyces palustris TaxID=1673888 RepID=A0ACD0NML2_9BASI|nr:hypothetical protein IE53DRAFT_364932 [Violaceomyces palustris]
MAKDTIFQHLPPDLSVSYQTSLVVFTTCLGALVLDIISHLKYDISLLLAPGWKVKSRAATRTAYLIGSCIAHAKALNMSIMIFLSSVDFLFVHRTLAVYSWEMHAVVLLSFLYLIVTFISIPALYLFATGIRVPGSDYCAYALLKEESPNKELWYAFHSLAIVLDTTLKFTGDSQIFFLTLHRLVEGGIPVFGKLGALLIKQVVRVAFLTIYFSFNEVQYAVLGAPFAGSLEPIVSGSFFRAQANSLQRAPGFDVSTTERCRLRGTVNRLGSVEQPCCCTCCVHRRYASGDGSNLTPPHHGDVTQSRNSERSRNTGLVFSPDLRLHIETLEVRSESYPLEPFDRSEILFRNRAPGQTYLNGTSQAQRNYSTIQLHSPSPSWSPSRRTSSSFLNLRKSRSFNLDRSDLEKDGDGVGRHSRSQGAKSSSGNSITHQSSPSQKQSHPKDDVSVNKPEISHPTLTFTTVQNLSSVSSAGFGDALKSQG